MTVQIQPQPGDPVKVPPYPLREKPTAQKDVTKTTKRNMRRQAEAEVLPWNRDLDFLAERANATWDDTVYSKETLEAMEAVRKHNMEIIDRFDGREIEKQRKSL